MSTILFSEILPGTYLNLNGELISLEQAKDLIASGERPVLFTVSDEHIQAALMDLSRARKEGREPEDYCAPDPGALRVVYEEVPYVDDSNDA